MSKAMVRQVSEWWLKTNKKTRIIMCGDFFQLPPYARGVGKTEYPFESISWWDLGLKPIILDEVVEQQDAEYIKMLHLARLGNQGCIEYFNSHAQKAIIESGIYLCALNPEADTINSHMVSKLPGMPREYMAKGNLKGVDFKKIRAAEKLVMKQNMRVMALRNDSQGRYRNGSLGCVVDMAEEYIRVRFDNGNEVNVYRTNFYGNQDNDLSERHCIQQFPLQVGYAITIHKSQGQMFDAVNVLATHCWEHGQLYVALSRVRTIQGLHLIEPLDPDSLVVDERVIDFYKDLEEEFYEMMEED